jgi:chaperonin GroES
MQLSSWGMEVAQWGNASNRAHSFVEGEIRMNLKPLGDRLVVQRQEAGDKTKGGTILPDTAKEKPQIGKVLAVGDGKILKDGKRQDLQVKKGDTILFSAYAGDEFKLDNEKVLLMREEDVLAILRD